MCWYYYPNWGDDAYFPAKCGNHYLETLQSSIILSPSLGCPCIGKEMCRSNNIQDWVLRQEIHQKRLHLLHLTRQQMKWVGLKLRYCKECVNQCVSKKTDNLGGFMNYQHQQKETLSTSHNWLYIKLSSIKVLQLLNFWGELWMRVCYTWSHVAQLEKNFQQLLFASLTSLNQPMANVTDS